MVGDDRVRFCGQCEKNVYNLSAMPRDEAEALLAAREGKMCVRLYKREDGTVMTSDCPVGVKRRRRRRAVAGVLGGGMMAATASLFATSTGQMQGSPVPTTGVPEIQGSAVILQGDPAPTADKDPQKTVMGQWAGGHPVMGAHAIMGKPAAPPPKAPPAVGRPAIK
jgi:hypothetical protein